MSFEVLLSAMHLKDETYVDSLNIVSDTVVINQCDTESFSDIERESKEGNIHKVRFICSKKRGLSISRNMAVLNSNADICILCDNDVEYVRGYETVIKRAYERHPDADLIVFFIKRKERGKPLSDRDMRMNYYTVSKIFSPEISFKRESIRGISFNENFGAGAKYILGEENIFLYDCLKAKKKIYYVPEKIAELREEESTWFEGYNERFFISRGANFTAMSRPFAFLFILQFAIRKRKLYIDTMPFMKAVSLMLKGKKEYEDFCDR
ncbi:MAG: glycosyltransferase family 2 protein [Lachnospiraceae bacterium]|nr:glycosyltransferase family 2 protein [Lachnospiraceae bacterium]